MMHHLSKQATNFLLINSFDTLIIVALDVKMLKYTKGKRYASVLRAGNTSSNINQSLYMFAFHVLSSVAMNTKNTSKVGTLLLRSFLFFNLLF